jgi:polysaccharide export outer membrane protein
LAAKSLLEALTDAGGQTSQAASEAEVSHTAGQKDTIDLKDYQAAQVYLLKDGDVVLVPKAQTFYINGEVRNQGMIVWQRNMTLSQAVTLAGGLTDRGSYRSAEATRVVNGKTVRVDLKQSRRSCPTT